jgi:hypothetical protein
VLCLERTRLLRITAFSAGLIVQLAFAAGLKGLFLVSALWSGSLAASFTHALPIVAGLFIAAAVLALALPRTAWPTRKRRFDRDGVSWRSRVERGA